MLLLSDLNLKWPLSFLRSFCDCCRLNPAIVCTKQIFACNALFYFNLLLLFETSYCFPQGLFSFEDFQFPLQHFCVKADVKWYYIYILKCVWVCNGRLLLLLLSHLALLFKMNHGSSLRWSAYLSVPLHPECSLSSMFLCHMDFSLEAIRSTCQNY